MVAVLLVAYVLNQLDRFVFGFLMEPIKREFLLSDSQLGFLLGPALVVLYACLGVPVARWADRSRRLTIIVVAVAAWSTFAMLTATVHQFWQLLLVRIGVGVGEAGFSAVALSVIGDYETDERRAQAVSTFLLAIPIAVVVSDLSGWINQFQGWRAVFLLAGMPGIPLALLLLITVREPPRRSVSRQSSVRPPLGVVLKMLWQRRSLRYLILAQGLANIALVAMNWLSVFFIRRHHMATGELGSWFAFTDGVGEIAGIWLSGVAVARFGARDPRMKTRLMAYSAAMVPPLALFVLLTPSKDAALVACLFLNISMFFFLAPSYALAQDLVGPEMRATVTAFFILVQLLAGGVLGTQLVGVLSDALTPLAGNSTGALQWSMAMTSTVAFAAALLFWRAGPYVKQESIVDPQRAIAHAVR